MRKRYRLFLPSLVAALFFVSGWAYVAGQENELLGRQEVREVAQSDERVTSEAPEEKRRWGSGEILLTEVQLKDAEDRAAHVFVPGDTLRIDVSALRRRTFG